MRNTILVVLLVASFSLNAMEDTIESISTKTVVAFLQSNDGGNISLNDKLEGGITLLHLACSDDRCKEVVESLLSKGVLIDKQADDGWTPLHVAAYCGLVGVVRLLLEKNADVQSKNIYGQTPYDLACEAEQTGVIEVLSEYGAGKSYMTYCSLM